jgi:hypothetical protein
MAPGPASRSTPGRCPPRSAPPCGGGGRTARGSPGGWSPALPVPLHHVRHKHLAEQCPQPAQSIHPGPGAIRGLSRIAGMPSQPRWAMKLARPMACNRRSRAKAGGPGTLLSAAPDHTTSGVPHGQTIDTPATDPPCPLSSAHSPRQPRGRIAFTQAPPPALPAARPRW